MFRSTADFPVLRLSPLPSFYAFPPFIAWYRYRRYLPAYYHWELVILFRKLGIVMGVLLFSSPFLVVSTAFVAVFTSLVLHVRAQPYRSERVNALESIHLICASLVLLMAGFLALLSEFASETIFVVIGVFVVAIIVANVIVMLVVVVKEIRYQWRLQVRLPSCCPFGWSGGRILAGC